MKGANVPGIIALSVVSLAGRRAASTSAGTLRLPPPRHKLPTSTPITLRRGLESGLVHRAHRSHQLPRGSMNDNFLLTAAPHTQLLVRPSLLDEC
jgi:hypothetical protein